MAQNPSRAIIGLACGIGFASTVWLANWLVEHYGAVSVGFGLVAPAGVYAAGLAFTLRDLTQRLLGKLAVVVCIMIGAWLSWWISDIQRIALASAVAFLGSELCDFVVYSRIEARSWLGAIAASNTVGLVIDSIIFLSIAFGSLTFLKGQIVGKLWMTLLAVVVLWMLSKVATDKTAFGDR